MAARSNLSTILFSIYPHIYGPSCHPQALVMMLLLLLPLLLLPLLLLSSVVMMAPVLLLVTVFSDAAAAAALNTRFMSQMASFDVANDICLVPHLLFQLPIARHVIGRHLNP